MPEFKNYEKQELLIRAKFLFDKGYRLEWENEYSLDLSNNNIIFALYSGRYSDKPNINFKFIKQNEAFDLGWISFIVDKERNIDQDNIMETLNYMLDFLEKHYDELVDINFCYEISKQIDKYVRENFESPIGFPRIQNTQQD